MHITDKKLPLSVAIITKNEEDNLLECLKSVSFAGEIVVVDSGSKDRTIDIAEQFGCRVYMEKWEGDGFQKNNAIGKCINEWVLVLDADERVPDSTRDEIIEIVLSDYSADAYSFTRKNFFHGRWIKNCGWWPDTVIRLVRKDTGSYSRSVHHGKWITNSKIAKTDVPIEHFSYSNYSAMLEIMDSRSTRIARELFDSGKRVNVLTPFSHGMAMLIKTYVIRPGFLDGFDGFLISLTKAGGSFFKYAKLLELQRKNII